MSPQPNIAVLLPCYNEQISIAKVVEDFKAALPQATIYVSDNNSRDGTIAEALHVGPSLVHTESSAKQGTCGASSVLRYGFYI